MPEPREDIYAERGRWPSGYQSKEIPGEAQKLKVEIAAGPNILGWCVCRFLTDDFGDGRAYALNQPGSRANDASLACGIAPGSLGFDPCEPILTCSKKDAEAMSGPMERGMAGVDMAFRCKQLSWRTVIVCSLDSSCTELYSGRDLAAAEAVRRRAQHVVGGRKFYPVKCIVEGSVRVRETT